MTDGAASPHFALGAASAQLLFEFAAQDTAVPAHIVPTLAAFLQAAGARSEIQVEPGTSHGDIFPSRPMHSPVAAQNSRQRISALFGRTLRR